MSARRDEGVITAEVAAPTVGEARTFAAALLRAAGMAVSEADTTARLIVLADAWGIPSHGLMRLPTYLQRTTAGGFAPDAQLRTVTDTGPVVALDGGGGIGHWQLWRAAQTATERCERFGLAAVSVGDSGHCGALGAYVWPAIDAGQVALVFSTGPAVMAPWGGHEPVLSTSPLAAGVPCRPAPLIVDLASSAVARGTVVAHARRGEPLGEGWALDADGRPTTDPARALRGLLAPLGGAKGSAIATVVEALAGAMVGPALAGEVVDPFDDDAAAAPQRLGHLVIALDPRALAVDGADAARDRFDELGRRVRAAGGRLPGSRRVRPSELDPEAPITVEAPLCGPLRAWAARLGVEAPDWTLRG